MTAPNGRRPQARGLEAHEARSGDRTTASVTGGADTVTRRRPTTTRVRGYAPWNPRPDTVDLLRSVDAVLTEYRAYLPLTLRQLFYRLVGAHGYAKTEAAYESLGEKVNRARRAGMVPWEAIRDDRPAFDEPFGYAHPQDYVDTLWDELRAEAYTRHPRQGQPTTVLVACEAAGMVPMIANAVRGYGATVMSSGGFDSVTAKRDIARRAVHRPLVVLHIGDLDPSGVHVYRALAEDVAAFAAAEGGRVELERVAVLPEHIETYNLPTAPPKASDRRAFDGQSVQCEALPPDVLRQLVVDAVERHTDLDVLRALHRQVDAERVALGSRLAAARQALMGGDR